MTYSIDDIQIFIATHNRADYLARAIESVLNQSVDVKEIVVVDNESTDNTEEVVNSYGDKGVKYVKTQGFLGNFKKIQELAEKKYLIAFHDDDIMHPRYLELALKALNKYENVSLLATRYTHFFDDALPPFPERISEEHYLFKTQKDFAKHLYFIERVAYATAIYDAKAYKSSSLEYEKYSKFNDWPFLVKISSFGKTVLLDDQNLFLARCHNRQDTSMGTNAPSPEQIVQWDKCFFDAIKINNNPFSLINWAFRIKARHYMKAKYLLFTSKEDAKKHSLEELWETASKFGVTKRFKRPAALEYRLWGLYIEKLWEENFKKEL